LVRRTNTPSNGVLLDFGAVDGEAVALRVGEKAAVALVADEALVAPLQLPLQIGDDGRAIGGVLVHLVEVAADDVSTPGERHGLRLVVDLAPQLHQDEGNERRGIAEHEFAHELVGPFAHAQHIEELARFEFGDRLGADSGEIVVPDCVRLALAPLVRQIDGLDEAIETIDKTLEATAKADETARRLMTIPGIGPITATALLATIQDFGAFSSGREFAAFLGLTPREHSSGGKLRLGRITKMGDRYLRKLLVQGACSALAARKGHRRPTPLGDRTARPQDRQVQVQADRGGARQQGGADRLRARDERGRFRRPCGRGLNEQARQEEFSPQGDPHRGRRRSDVNQRIRLGSPAKSRRHHERVLLIGRRAMRTSIRASGTFVSRANRSHDCGAGE
jgi:hypothetical protein